MKKFISLMILVSTIMVTLHATETKVGEVLDAYINAWNEHDVKKIESFYADDVEWYDLSYDYTTKGKKNVAKSITDAFLGYVPDMYWKKSGDLFVSDNTVVYEWVYGGTFDGEWDGKKIHNKRFEIKGMSTATIDGSGKIVAHKDYYDLYGFKKQLGLIK